ncbi:hypothetical protein ACS0TY_017624 [Phlomoides rotata]
MVNEDWLVWRPDLKLKGLGRTISDLCPIILWNSVTDWGPKPFKFFNGWIMHPKFKQFCQSKWESYSVIGWKSISLKEKLKMLKLDLKVWSREKLSSLQHKMISQREDIERLDRFDEVFGLEEEEDHWRWTGACDGRFSTMQAYKLLVQSTVELERPDDLEAFQLLWKCSSTRRVQSIAWKILKSRLPTRDEIRKRGIITDSQDTKYPCCEIEEELVPHLFF